MPIDTSSYCKQCGKYQVDGLAGRWLREMPDVQGVCICAPSAKVRLVEGSDKGIISNPSLMSDLALKAGTPTSEGSSWRPKGDKFSVNPVTRINPRMRTESERNNGREIERKYRLMDEVSLSLYHNYLSSIYKHASFIEGTSIDIFWKHKGVDFIRLRENTLELTVKVTDGSSIENRIENNLKVENFEKGLKWATTVFGNPVGANRTTFYIYYLPTAEVTIYEVKGYDQVFLEIEAGSIEEIERIENILKSTLRIEQEFKSLFQILFGDK